MSRFAASLTNVVCPRPYLQVVCNVASVVGVVLIGETAGSFDGREEAVRRGVSEVSPRCGMGHGTLQRGTSQKRVEKEETY